jgi:transcriptional regulator with XRE-family HTH domain
MATAQIGSDKATYRNRLREAREAAGCSVNELKERSGYWKKGISDTENRGAWPSEETRQKLADVLGVNVGWLFYIEGETRRVSKH